VEVDPVVDQQALEAVVAHGAEAVQGYREDGWRGGVGRNRERGWEGVK